MKKLSILLLFIFGFSSAANAQHKQFHRGYHDPSTVYLAEIDCELPSMGLTGLHACVDGEFLKLKKNNIKKAYTTDDFYVN